MIMLKKLLLFLILIPFLNFAQDFSQFELNDLQGNTFRFKENLNHDATVITFWATWCLPCLKEHPTLQQIKEKYKDKDVQIIAISVDSPRSMAKVKSYSRSHKYDFVYLVDPDREMASQLLVNDVPQTFIINKKGKVVYQHTGYRKGDELELEKELLKLWDETKKQD